MQRRFIRRFLWVVVFISDTAVHQHGVLVESAGWVGGVGFSFYLPGFMKSLKHLFRPDSPVL